LHGFKIFRLVVCIQFDEFDMWNILKNFHCSQGVYIRNMIIHLASNLIILFATFSTLCHDYTVPHEFLMCFFIINNSQSQGGDFVAEMLKEWAQNF
jgi:hypothetical protein